MENLLIEVLESGVTDISEIAFVEHLRTQINRLKKHNQTTFYCLGTSCTILWAQNDNIRFFAEWLDEEDNIKYFDYLIPKERFYVEVSKMFKCANDLINKDIAEYKGYLIEHNYPTDYKLP